MPVPDIDKIIVENFRLLDDENKTIFLLFLEEFVTEQVTAPSGQKSTG